MTDETEQTDKPARARLMTPKEAAAETTLSAMQLSTMAARGEFPKPVWISKGRSAYVTAEVMAWIDSRIADRDARPQGSPAGATDEGEALSPSASYPPSQEATQEGKP